GRLYMAGTSEFLWRRFVSHEESAVRRRLFTGSRRRSERRRSQRHRVHRRNGRRVSPCSGFRQGSQGTVVPVDSSDGHSRPVPLSKLQVERRGRWLPVLAYSRI